MRLHEARKDLYRRLAREQGYRSRAAFKLIEANEKYGFIRSGDRVVDLGASPGGWTQVAEELVGESGLVVGVDVNDVHVRTKRNVASVKADVADPALAERLEGMLMGKADVVLSDLAPSVSGVWELDQSRQADLTLAALGLSRRLLREDGKGFFKLFEGPRSQEVRAEMKKTFRTVRPMKPAASRSSASELYYYCERLTGT
jgi:23S rRNA (uridine2552-2'-O)-methyltransferase